MSPTNHKEASPGEELRGMLSRCVRCGKCRAVCPVFGVVGREPAVARGKLALLDAVLNGGRERFGKGLHEALSLCLLCGRCTSWCPNGAGAKEAVERARAIMIREGELPKLKRWLSRITSVERSKRDPWVRAAGALQSSLAALTHKRGLMLRLADRLSSRFWAPHITPPFFLERFRGLFQAGEPVGRVGLFVGCSIHYLAPQVGEAALSILNAMGWDVVVPEGQGCCGLMASGMGDRSTALRLAEEALEGFSSRDWEAIVVPCASCAYHLSRGVPELLRNHPLASSAVEMASKVRELSVFLVEIGICGRLAIGKSKGSVGSVTYHDPCHLAVGMKVRSEPRELLRRLSGWVFREMPGADRCCGMGGSFRLFHPTISRLISGEKIRLIQEAKADIIATTCMGCWIQLQEMLQGSVESSRVSHVAELVWEELEDEPTHGRKGRGP